MANFGYGSMKSNICDLDTANRELAITLAKKEPTFNLCIACGCCTATCSAGKFVPFSIRTLIHHIRRGETDTAEKEAAKCMLCGKCTLVCPRNVNTRNVILLIREATQNLKR